MPELFRTDLHHSFFLISSLSLLYYTIRVMSFSIVSRSVKFFGNILLPGV